MGIESIDHLISGFAQSLTMVNFLACFFGALIGTIVGVLPGLGPTATMALMLPFTMKYGPTAGLIMMTGVWYGAMYGGSTTSILVNIPGEAASVITCIDGYQMAKKGRAGAALAMVAVGSFIAGAIGILGLQIFAPPLGKVALSFGPPEYLAFMILAFLLLSNLSEAPPSRSLVMTGLGLFVSSVGIDSMTSVNRFVFGFEDLTQGIEFLPIAMGFFGMTELLCLAIETYAPPVVQKIRMRDMYPNQEEIRRSGLPILRGSVLGFFVGLVPGPCTVISTFLSYAMEKRFSKHPERFGTGEIEGVAGPEAANNSAVLGSMIPLLTLGIPFAAPSAVLLAGLRLHQVEPGPLLFQNSPEIFWTFIAAMYIGNLMLLVLNLPLVGLFARISTIRPKFLVPCITIICLVGIYSVRNSIFDVWVMIAAGVIGVFLRKWELPIAPFIIGMVLGPTTEASFRQTLMLFKGNVMMIFDRPVAMAFILITIVFIVVKVLFKTLRRSAGGANA
ncbi:MAG: tripartite tricarboxylate transporter permease [Deltaproteobacteria bacterium]|nr:tripartite tricarboxylate transporter permease [Deltaproteobacteria bacterium]